MTREEKQIFQITHKKCRMLTAVSLCLMIGLVLTKMVVSNQASNEGLRLEATKQETERVKQENLYLKTELAGKTGGLDQLSQEALGKGFTNDIQVQYFQPPETVALILP